ncbi:phospholipase D family protein [Musicola paradisiaca]|uniref:PLD phosphodiesterase domain-containing protein n=1 Tax=Musicola paradisiaca (strain Ech703) TaxID=579405 RepID=C6C7N3_MUSP7|nr:phospholipase D family protein [Musicola paradisiaca]ACS85975.1 hypothetical protein Dd703_2188 [Musicola paradisiaca Ech703]
MNILDDTSCLEDYLKSHRGKKINIITAFASGTEEILSALLDNNNTIELLVGTINAFTAPKFIEYCAEHNRNNFRTFVDFGYESSIHWKLYLIEPDIVVIGSANFTKTGLSLRRDTCVVMENIGLYTEYVRRFRQLLTAKSVIKADKSSAFQFAFNHYRRNHNKTQAGLARSRHYSSAEAWLLDESNQTLPLFLWCKRHSAETKTKATQLLQAESAEADPPLLRDFFTYDAKQDELPFQQGDVVLCANHRGSYIDFYTFDRIIYSEGRHFLYSYRRNRYQRPFELNTLKTKLKHAIPQLFERDATCIDRDELQEILHLT